MDFNWENALFGSLFLLLLAGVLYSTWRNMQARDRRWRRSRVEDGFAISARKPVRSEERRFRQQFPELQPFFHPEKAILFVREQRRFKPKNDAAAKRRWMPAGFNTWTLVTENPGERVQRLQLRSWRNALLASFTYQATGDGAILRLGEGEMTVVDSKDNAHAHYRHPQRQFRWTAKKGWSVGVPGAAERRGEYLESTPVDHGYRDHAGAAAVAAAVFTGAAGTFDGGGASESWESAADDGGDGGDSGDSSTD